VFSSGIHHDTSPWLSGWSESGFRRSIAPVRAAAVGIAAVLTADAVEVPDAVAVAAMVERPTAEAVEVPATDATDATVERPVADAVLVPLADATD
jgi:hypothetical protein